MCIFNAQRCKRVLDELNTTKGWDQAIINRYLRNNDTSESCVNVPVPIKVSKFDHRIHCGWSFNPSYKESFFVFKSFIHHKNDKIVNFNKRIDIFFQAGLINETQNNNIIINI